MPPKKAQAGDPLPAPLVPEQVAVEPAVPSHILFPSLVAEAPAADPVLAEARGGTAPAKNPQAPKAPKAPKAATAAAAAGAVGARGGRKPNSKNWTHEETMRFLGVLKE